MDIRIDDLSGPEIRALLEEHLRNMHAWSPPESVHALDLDALRHPTITFWTIWDGPQLMGCGALRELSSTEGEIKSMRTPQASRRSGAGRAMLQYIVAEAARRHYQRLYLETGAFDAFLPARTLYAQHGFVPCPPFGDYVDDPNSVFMLLQLPVASAPTECGLPQSPSLQCGSL